MTEKRKSAALATAPAIRRSPNVRSLRGSTASLNYKTILLGDSGVGKTSLFIRLTQGRFNEQEVPATLQMDIGRVNFKIR